MNNKIITDYSGFCDIHNNQGQGRGYQPNTMTQLLHDDYAIIDY